MVIEPTADDVITTVTYTDSAERVQHPSKPWLKQFPKGVSGNPAGRPKRKSLKELAQEDATPETLLSFVRHVREAATESTSATAVRWAQLYIDILGESGASFKLAIEASGWDSFQSDVLRALLQSDTLPERLDSGNQAPPEANT